MEFRFCPLCRNALKQKKVDNVKRLVCSKCGWVYYRNPLPIVICAVKDKENKILVAKRNTKPSINKWALPGGFIELDETPKVACLRELKEETGLKGKVERLIGVYIQKSKYYGSLLVIGYEVSISENGLSLNSELKEAKFFDKENLPIIPFLSHRKVIKEVF